MDFRSLVPFAGSELGRRGETDPFQTFRRDFDRMVDEMLRGPARWPSATGAAPAAVDLRLDVGETDKEIKVRAELPGVDEQDVEVTLADDVLTIKGEKRVEEERKGENHHMVERSYGSFARSLRLPSGIDQSQVHATFDKGVLTVTLPKPAEARQRSRKIEIKKSK
ncbi:MAG: Hsp20/alpha crystallin family protein [Geminicoccaceae bacterium]|nr:Hsp20/alpha crystallin family protein [Geminicoccaceae bacterium]